MGILCSLLQSIIDCFKSPSQAKYEQDLADKPKLHYKCRSTNEKNLTPYQANIDYNHAKAIVYRVYVPDSKVSWSVKWPEYKPVEYTAPKLLKNKPDWADVENPLDIKNWNCLDGNVNRQSHLGDYEVIDGIPRNPVGRTGICGRGQLGKWGVNHAADPIVTRWKIDENGQSVYHKETGKRILQFVAIRRADTKQWAIPGGMCDPGEKVSTTLKREFMEEAANVLTKTNKSKKDIEDQLQLLFDNGTEIYKGYVDDPRNTDNAWMETAAYNFHDEDGNLLKNFVLEAGDDAEHVQWLDADNKLELYASHKDFIEKAVGLHNCHW